MIRPLKSCLAVTGRSGPAVWARASTARVSRAAFSSAYVTNAREPHRALTHYAPLQMFPRRLNTAAAASASPESAENIFDNAMSDRKAGGLESGVGFPPSEHAGDHLGPHDDVGPLQEYDRRVWDGLLRNDDHQRGMRVFVCVCNLYFWCNPSLTWFP